MTRILDWLSDLGHRGYLYRVLFAAGAVAVAYGAISAEHLAVWLGLAATMLGTGTAAVHTPTSAQLRARSSLEPRRPARRRKFDR